MSLEQLKRHLGVELVFSKLQYLDGYGWHMSMTIPGYICGLEHCNDDPSKIQPEIIRQAFECFTSQDIAEMRRAQGL